jgi:hypothetical protein
MPYQQMPEPLMTSQSTPQQTNKNKGIWMIVLGLGAFFLFQHALKKELKKR